MCESDYKGRIACFKKEPGHIWSHLIVYDFFTIINMDKLFEVV